MSRESIHRHRQVAWAWRIGSRMPITSPMRDTIDRHGVTARVGARPTRDRHTAKGLQADSRNAVIQEFK